MFNRKKWVAAALGLATAATSMASFAPANAAETADEEVQFSAPISEIVDDSGLDIDYARALQYSLYFYDANMCGDTVDNDSRLS